MKKGLNSFRHLEITRCQVPKQIKQTKQIGFRKDRPVQKTNRP